MNELVEIKNQKKKLKLFFQHDSLGGSAVRGLEDGVAGLVVDVASGGNANTADLGRQRVAEVVAVQVHRGHNVKVRGAVCVCCVSVLVYWGKKCKIKCVCV